MNFLYIRKMFRSFYLVSYLSYWWWWSPKSALIRCFEICSLTQWRYPSVEYYMLSLCYMLFYIKIMHRKIFGNFVVYWYYIIFSEVFDTLVWCVTLLMVFIEHTHTAILIFPRYLLSFSFRAIYNMTLSYSEHNFSNRPTHQCDNDIDKILDLDLDLCCLTNSTKHLLKYSK